MTRKERKHWSILLAVTLAAAWSTRAAYPAQPVVESDAGHLILIPRLDGQNAMRAGVDESPWTHAACVTGFYDVSGERMSEARTRAWVFHDRSSLWFLFRCEGQAVDPTITERDGKVWRDDSVEVMVGPSHSHGDYYHIVTNTAGIVYDGFNGDPEWNGNVETRAEVDPDGWTAVLRVDFSSFDAGPAEPGDVWTVNFCRNGPGKLRSSWAAVSGAFNQPKRFGHLIFGPVVAEPVRFHAVDPIRIGENRLHLDAPLKIVCHITGTDSTGQLILNKSQSVTESGAMAFLLEDDRVRWLGLSFVDDRGSELARCRFPMESPSVRERIEGLQRQYDKVDKLSGRFPEAAQDRLKHVLEEIRPRLAEAAGILGEPQRHTPGNWERLEEVANTAKSINAAWCYAETLDRYPEAGCAVGLESSMNKVMIRDFPFTGRFARTQLVQLAQNEHEAFQVSVIPFHVDVSDVRVTVSPLKRKSDRAPTDEVAVKVSLVGHVDVSDNPAYDADYHGWWPDILLDFQNKCDVQAGDTVAFWVDVRAATDAAPGIYLADLTISAREHQPIVLDLEVEVWDFTLPTRGHLRTAFTYHAPRVRQLHGDEWSDEMARRYVDLVLDHRLGVDHLYRGEPPSPELIEYAVGKGMNAFNLAYIGQGADIAGALEKLQGSRQLLGNPQLKNFAYIYGYDEVKEDTFDRMRRVLGAVRKRYPGVPIMTTAYDPSFGRDTVLGEVIDIWVPLTDWYDLDAARRLRAEGKKMWWYVCISPHHPYANWFIEYPAIEARLLTGAMSYKYQTDGFLYYQMCMWGKNKKPVTSGPYTDWDPVSFVNRAGRDANGDGSLICPGPDGPLATIRLANIRDGLEDYEYLYLLASLARTARDLPPDDGKSAWLEQADRLLAVPDEIVRDLTTYTRASDRLDAFRTTLAESILEGSRFVERSEKEQEPTTP